MFLVTAIQIGYFIRNLKKSSKKVQISIGKGANSEVIIEVIGFYFEKYLSHSVLGRSFT